MNARRMAVLGAIGAILASAPALARDPGSGEYDQSRLVRMEGMAVKVDFATPYSYIYVDVAGDDGDMAIWTVRMPGADVLTNQGWKQNSISPGAMVEVLVYRAKDGTHRALAYSIKRVDGGEVFTNSGERK
jgi:Family of unknown function (DUF6152)